MPKAPGEQTATRLVRAALEAAPRLAMSRAMGRVASAKVPAPLRRPVYGAFARAVGARLDEAADHVESFASFNAFFTRRLREGVRPDLGMPGGWVSPADGRLDQLGRVDSGTLVQAKGISYSASELLQDPDADSIFDGGVFATIYLSPADYHRVHAPCDMSVDEVVHVGGDLRPVNGLYVPHHAGLFSENERVVLRFCDGGGRRSALVLVGAMIVGGIALANGTLLRTDHRVECMRQRLNTPWTVRRMEEVGRFLLGSTVILLSERSDTPLRPSSTANGGTSMRLGEALFEPVA